MKHYFVTIVTIFGIWAVSLSFILSIKTFTSNDYSFSSFSTDDGIVLNGDEKTSKVVKNQLKKTVELVGLTSFNKAIVKATSGEFKIGECYPSGKTVAGVDIPYSFRSISFEDGRYVVENLDTGSVLSAMDPESFLSYSSLSAFLIKLNGHEYEPLSTSIVYVNYTTLFVFRLVVGHGEKYLSNTQCLLSFTGVTDLGDGLYVQREFVFSDDGGSFVYKLINQNGNRRAKKVLVDILGTSQGFYHVEANGNLLDGNMLVILD